MRKVAVYAFGASTAGLGDADKRFREIADLYHAWLSKKGKVEWEDDCGRIELGRGKNATCRVEEVESRAGTLRSWCFEEDHDAGKFRTTIGCALTDEELTLNCTLEVGSSSTRVAPVRFDPHCPNIIRDIVKMDVEWEVAGTPISAYRKRLIDRAGGEKLAEMIVDVYRRIPIVVVSELDGFMLEPKLDQDLAHDLTGLATVVSINGEASWALTRIVESRWSCFHGGIRIYWPGVQLDRDDCRYHNLWTTGRLLERTASPVEAASMIRRQIRRMVLGLSCFTVKREIAFDRIRHARRLEETEARLAAAESSEEYLEIAQMYAADNEELQARIEELVEQNSRLETDLQNQQFTQDWMRQQAALQVEEGEVDSEVEIPPATIMEAYERARDEFAEDLTFGDDVEEGIDTVDPQAGPPGKVLDWLRGLADMARTRRRSSLGQTVVKWLCDRGLTTSGESETTLNSDDEMKKRTWHDGQGKRRFELHMKPAEGVSPDRCVRVYFDWDDTTQKAVVGWIGRHP